MQWTMDGEPNEIPSEQNDAPFLCIPSFYHERIRHQKENANNKKQQQQQISIENFSSS